MKSNRITTVEQAINAIVHYNTLPSQIDYRVPERNKSTEAEEYLETLGATKERKALNEVERQIDEYYSPSFIGEDGVEYSCADMNEMF